MIASFWLIIALPLSAFAVLILSGSALGERRSGRLGCGAVMLSAIVAAIASVRFLRTPPPKGYLTGTAWHWIVSGPLRVDLTFRFDALSLVMVLVITIVAALILLYSVRFMAGEKDYGRYFAFMNLFVASMLLLVLADDLLVLFLGWEGVGLCSYLLIGFWYRDESAVLAARKAFVMTRIGDTALLLGIILLATRLGSLRIEDILSTAGNAWHAGAALPAVVALLLLLGAIGKSAQLPLQTWLPDAMAGPTPVSALIHAATMVTAGVYLIARLHGLFELAPLVMRLVAALGAATLLLGGAAAFAERDIKRVLAYSTMSQIGYMFLALGAGAWTAAMFHFVTHAFFKALLFLAAGIVIHSVNGERDMLKIGGLWRKLPLTFAAFTAGACSLAALPVFTAGFYSKDLILYSVAASASGGIFPWICGLTGAFITGLYSFRMLFLVFFGERKIAPAPEAGISMLLPIIVLAAGALTIGFLETPPALGGVSLFSNHMNGILGSPSLIAPLAHDRLALLFLAAFASLAGLFVAWQRYLRNRRLFERFVKVPAVMAAYGLCAKGFAFDAFYSAMIVRPFSVLVKLNKADFTLAYSTALARLIQTAHALLSRTQNGKVRFSVMGIALGAALLLAIGIFS
ncbi:MAG: NADH-quinone oxidoreductase subunit L [Chitinispirillaceae bacterium]|jgi:NADH-quinone oxidoreductase subunit L